MIAPSHAIILGLAAPLAVALLTPFLGKRPQLRDVLGPIGGVITFVAALQVALAVIAGDTPE